MDEPDAPPSPTVLSPNTPMQDTTQQQHAELWWMNSTPIEHSTHNNDLSAAAAAAAEEAIKSLDPSVAQASIGVSTPQHASAFTNPTPSIPVVVSPLAVHPSQTTRELRLPPSYHPTFYTPPPQDFPTPPNSSPPHPPQTPIGEREYIDLASASILELQRLPSVTRYYAQKIHDFRQHCTDFSVETLVAHKIVKPTIFDTWLEAFESNPEAALPCIGSQNVAYIWKNNKTALMERQKALKRRSSRGVASPEPPISNPIKTNVQKIRIDLASADAAELQKLPGITRYYAQKLLQHRDYLSSSGQCTDNKSKDSWSDFNLQELLLQKILKPSILESWMQLESTGGMSVSAYIGDDCVTDLWKEYRKTYFDIKNSLSRSVSNHSSRKRTFQTSGKSNVDADFESDKRPRYSDGNRYQDSSYQIDLQNQLLQQQQQQQQQQHPAMENYGHSVLFAAAQSPYLVHPSQAAIFYGESSGGGGLDVMHHQEMSTGLDNDNQDLADSQLSGPNSSAFAFPMHQSTAFKPQHQS